ncbi:MAG: ABC transporter permease [Saprospiraceae bacterium]|nr:ABC transporter permease [Saprospiraceae bacterium]MBK7738499.1 ABC transporter permease [Saprospiraceae bacterium]MBK7912929.1 ABC transporter permease [Saprospiraceae bacterium]
MILKLIWRNLWRNHRRTLITTASITFAVLFCILMQSFQKGAFDNLIKNVVGYYSGYVQIHKSGYWNERVLDNCFELNDSLIQKIRQQKNILDFVPRLETFTLASFNNTTKACLLVGTDPIKEKQLTHLDEKLIAGTYFKLDEEHALIAEGLASRLNIKLNDTLVLFGQGFQGTLAAGKYKIIGIVHLASPEMNNSFVYLPLKAAQNVLNAENRISTMALILSNPLEKLSIVTSLRAQLTADYEIMDWEEMMPEISNHIKADESSFYIFSAVLYLIIGFGFFGTVLMMTAERKREFGMLISIGLKKLNLGLILLGETVLITLLGVLSGILLSFPFVLYLNRNPIRFTGEMAKAYEKFGFEPVIPTAVDSSIFLSQSSFVLLLTFLIGMYPIWHIHKLDAVKALRN